MTAGTRRLLTPSPTAEHTRPWPTTFRPELPRLHDGEHVTVVHHDVAWGDHGTPRSPLVRERVLQRTGQWAIRRSPRVPNAVAAAGFGVVNEIDLQGLSEASRAARCAPPDRWRALMSRSSWPRCPRLNSSCSGLGSPSAGAQDRLPGRAGVHGPPQTRADRAAVCRSSHHAAQGRSRRWPARRPADAPSLLLEDIVPVPEDHGIGPLPAEGGSPDVVEAVRRKWARGRHGGGSKRQAIGRLSAIGLKVARAGRTEPDGSHPLPYRHEGHDERPDRRSCRSSNFNAGRPLPAARPGDGEGFVRAWVRSTRHR